MRKSSLVPALVALTLALLLALSSAHGADPNNSATITGDVMSCLFLLVAAVGAWSLDAWRAAVVRRSGWEDGELGDGDRFEVVSARRPGRTYSNQV
jgi:hypothetical protein